MEKIKHFIFKSRYVFTMLIAIFAVIFSVLHIKVHAATSYTVNGYTFDKELSGDLPTTTGNYYLAHDYYFPDENLVVTKTIRIYLNGHNIYTNGHNIILANGYLGIFEDHTNQTFYDVASDGTVSIGSGSNSIMGGYITTGSGSNDLITLGGDEYAGNLELFGGNIFDNGGCGVRIYKGTFYMRGGKVAGNRGDAAVYIDSNGTLEMSGGSIENNYTKSTSVAGGVYHNGTMQVYNSPSIINNKKGSTVSNVTLATAKKITVSDVFTGNIGITSESILSLTSGFGANNSAKKPENYFFSDDTTKSITSIGVTNLEAIFGTPSETQHRHDSITFTKYEYDTDLPGVPGDYYLTKDVTLNRIWQVQPGIFSICLNGHSINLNGYYIELKYGTTLRIYDCNDSVHHYSLDNTGLGVVGSGGYSFKGGYIYGATNNRAINLTSSNETKNFMLYGGTIIGNSAGAISFEGSKSKCLLYGGYVIGNTTKNATEKNGSAIYGNDNANLYLDNVTIENNRTYSSQGGAVSILKTTTIDSSAESSVHLIGGNVIIYNNTNNNGANANLLFESSRKIYVHEKIDNSLIGIFVKSSVNSTITTSYGKSGNSSQNINTYFKSDLGNEVISYEGSGNSLEAKIAVEHKHESQSYTEFARTQHFPSSISNNVYYYLSGDYILDSDWKVPASASGYIITICLCGHNINLNGHTITIPANASLVIKDCTHNTNRYSINDNGIAIVDGTGDHEFTGGYIYDSSARNSTSASNKSFLNLTGGFLNLDNVSVIGAYAENGAINISSGTFYMNDNVVAGCVATNGAAINASGTGSITINRSKLLYNTATNDGGAIYSFASFLTINNSDISYNKAASNGGAIFNSNGNANVTINSCNISHNEAYDGGAMCFYLGKGNVNDSLFSYNKANGRGGAIYNGVTNNGGAKLTLTRVIINYNKALDENGRGGGIYNACYLYLKTYVSIENNKAKKYDASSTGGAGVYNYGNMYIEGKILISNNYSSNNKLSNLLLGKRSLGAKVYVTGDLTGSKIYVGSVEKECQITTDYTTYNSGIDPSTYFVKEALECESVNATIGLIDDEVWLIGPHEHVFTISKINNELQVTCSAPGCDVDSFTNIILSMDNFTYDGLEHNASINASTFESETGLTLDYSIIYKKGNTTTTTLKDVGTYIATASITVNGENYTLTKVITITPKTITVSDILANDKTFDGTTSAILNTSGVTFNGIADGDTLTISGTGTFDNKNAGENKTVTISNLVLGGSSSENYKLAASGNQTTTTANIIEKEVTVSGITANNKVYDGATNATLDYSGVTFNGIIDGDNLTVAATGAYNNKNVGENKTVTISNLVLGGSSANNYQLKASGNQATTTANISRKEVTVSGITASNKIYDGTTTATLITSGVTFNGIIDGDNLTVTATGTYNNKNVGENKTVTISNLVLGGSSANNYQLKASGNQTTTTANISRKEVTVSGITANNKVYDGTSSATLDYSEVTFDGIIVGDILTVSATGSFDNPNYGVDKTVSINNLVLGGESIDNYVLAISGNQETTIASITKEQIDVTVTGYTGTYDKETHKITITGIPAGSTIKYSLDNETFSTDELTFINVGTYTVYYLVECDNYETISGFEAIIINQKEVTVSNILVDDKVYDGNTNATLKYDQVLFDGIISGDILNVTATATFDSKNAGENKVVTINEITIDNDNYLLLTETLEASANISKRNVKISGIKANDKISDGNTNVILDFSSVNIDGLVTGDELTVTATASFDNAEVGNNKNVLINDLELDGLDSDNYVIEVEESQKEAKANILEEPNEVVDPGNTTDPTTPTEPTNSENNDPVNPVGNQTKGKKNNVGLVIVIILGVVGIIGIVGTVSFVLIKKKH